MNDTDFSFLIASKFPGTGPSYLNCSSFCLKYKTRSFNTVFIVSFGKYFENNIRMKFMLNLLDKMDPDKKRIHFEKADTFLKNLV